VYSTVWLSNVNENITNYIYDSIGRLSGVSEADGTSTAYTFDAQGNIMTKTITHPSGYEFAFKQNGQDYTLSNVATHEFTYAYDKNNRLKFEGEYIGGSGDNYTGFLEITKYNEYDNNGNLIKSTKGGQIDESVVQYSYNSLNQLTQYTDESGIITNYAYNPNGQRISKTQNNTETKYYWDRDYISSERSSGNVSAKNYIGVTGIFARETTNGTDYMLKNGHGDVTALVNNGAVIKTYDYDAYGVEKNINTNDTNPFRYCGEYFDTETGQIYLRNRYYDPTTGRFTQQDPAEDGYNWYVYGNQNPVIYADFYGLVPKEVADEIIKQNAEAIKHGGEYYGVNPAIIASCIYTEQTENVDWFDELTDIPLFWADTSIGIGQVKTSTAILLEDSGYIASTTFSRSETYGDTLVFYWNVPGVGEVVADSRKEAVAYRLLSDTECIYYVAAYLKYWQDRWKEVYPEIDGRTAILATLFNQGERKPPNSNPKPNEFGIVAKENYYHMKELLGIE